MRAETFFPCFSDLDKPFATKGDPKAWQSLSRN
jgi:hypothetical protein